MNISLEEILEMNYGRLESFWPKIHFNLQHVIIKS